MKFVFTGLLCTVFSFTSFAQFTATISPGASVVFPSKPKEMQDQGHRILFNTLDQEHKITAMATTIDATQYGVDSGMLIANYNNPLFVDLVLQNITGQYSGMQLISKKKIAKDRLMGYDVVLNNEIPTQEVPYKDIYVQVLFAGAKIYALTVLAEDKVEAVVLSDKFFNSLKVD